MEGKSALGTTLDKTKAGPLLPQSFALSRLGTHIIISKCYDCFKGLCERKDYTKFQITKMYILGSERERPVTERGTNSPVTPKRPSMACARTVHRVAFWDIFLLWAFLPPWWILENGIRRRKFVQVSLERRPDRPKNSKCSNTIPLVFVSKFSWTCTLCAVFQIFKFERRFGNSTARQDE